MIINKTALPSDIITRTIEDAIRFFLDLYPDVHLTCAYDIVLCDSTGSLQDEWRRYYGFDQDRVLPLPYDGQFLSPVEKTDTLTILACVKEEILAGAAQYHREVDHGLESPLEQDELEERGLKLMPFYEFVELLFHEFSHLCSFDRMMTLTDWADPQMSVNVLDYHLHDEFIARIRGTEAMLRMGAPYMETDLIYSLYQYYMTGLTESFNDRYKGTLEYINKARFFLHQEMMELQGEFDEDDLDWDEDDFDDLYDEDGFDEENLDEEITEKLRNSFHKLFFSSDEADPDEDPEDNIPEDFKQFIHDLLYGSDDNDDGDISDEDDSWTDDDWSAAPALTDEELLHYLEQNLGHKLRYGFVDEAEESGSLVESSKIIITASGRPLRITDLEVIEFYVPDEEKTHQLQVFDYFLKNPYAMYEGTQLAGMSAAFWRAFCGSAADPSVQDINDGNTGVDDWNLQLDQVIDIPFWQYIDREKIERQTQAFFVWLTERSGLEG